MQWSRWRPKGPGTEHELRQLRLQLEHLEKTMVTRVEFDAVVGPLEAAVGRITTDIQALRDKLNNGVEITDEDLAKLQGLTSQIDTADPVPAG